MPDEQPSSIQLHVYVAVGTAAASRTLHHVRTMVEQHLDGDALLSIIDVLASPEVAEEADVLVTPTVDCVWPLPRRRVVGVPSSADDLARALILDRPEIRT